MKKSFVILHISDLHLTRHFLKKRDMLTKRATGYLNICLRRKNVFQNKMFENLLKSILKQNYDLLCITGDITNLSYDDEFKEAREKLNPLLKHQKTILIPGNHDRYVKSATKADYMQKYFSDVCPFFWEKQKKEGYFIQVIYPNILLIGLDMCVPRTYLSARGKINQLVLDTCFESLQKEEYQNMKKIVIGHYPLWLPENMNEGYLHQLGGKEITKKFLESINADLYLHGHIHKSWKIKPNKNTKLICINSGGACQTKENASYHRIEIKEQKPIDIQKIYCV